LFYTHSLISVSIILSSVVYLFFFYAVRAHLVLHSFPTRRSSDLVYLNEGQLERAEQIFQEALADFQQAGDEPNELSALANLADVQFLRGNLPRAGRLYQQGLERGASLDASNVGYFLTRMADLQL